MSRIFLSHHHDESREAVALKQWLSEQDPPLAHEIFLDVDRRTGIGVGRWKSELLKAKSRCEAVICLLSKKWSASTECQLEYRHAEDMGKQIICARLEQSTGDDLTRDWQRFDLFGGGAQTEIDIGDEAKVTFASEGLYRLRDGITGAGITAESFVWPPPGDLQRAPYRGWEPLAEEDAGVFFGRDAELVLALDALREMRRNEFQTMFVVLGPSGSGKSSFLRAGLLPRLRRDDRHFVLLGIMRPERRALTGKTGLANAIYEGRSRLGLEKPTLGAIKSACTDDPIYVRELLLDVQRTAATRLPGRDAHAAPPTVVLPIDQAEELFSSDAGAEALSFLDLIGKLARPHEDGTRLRCLVAVTIRTDRYEVMQTAPGLAGLQTELFDDLKPMPATQFEQVITGPAARFGEEVRQLQIQPALRRRLLADCNAGGDTLPLLALTLARLFADYGSENELTVAQYEEMGALRNVVQSQIDEVLAVDETDRAIQLAQLRLAFIPWLATVNRNNEPMRRVARWSDLPPDSRDLIDKFVMQRLLVKDERDDEVVVEVALESLLRQWNDLASWLQKQSNELKDVDSLEIAAEDWARNHRDDTWLLQGARLAAAEVLAAQPEFHERLAPMREYLGASRKRENHRGETEQRRRIAADFGEGSSDVGALPGIFVSYSSLDVREARALKAWLVAQEPALGDKIFVADDADAGVVPGDRWRDSLRQGMFRTDVVICLVSRNWEASHESVVEFRTAENLGKQIFVASLEPSAGLAMTAEWLRCDLFGDGATTAVDIGSGEPVRFSSEGLYQLRDGILGPGKGTGAGSFEWPPSEDPGRAPYRGWQPFEEIDAGIFFGRSSPTAGAMEQLRAIRATGETTLFAIVGPSGVGKSSFLRAGVLPRLRYEANKFVTLDVVRPQRAVLTGDTGLASAIYAARNRFGLGQKVFGDIKHICFSADVERVHALLAEIRQAAWDQLPRPGSDAPTLVLPLDQADELFRTDCGAEATTFLDLLRGLADLAEDGARATFTVALTIRSYNVEHLQTATQLARFRTVFFDEIRPMSITQFKDVITGPPLRSRSGGVPLTIESQLVDRLLADAAGGADPLPILSRTMARFYADCDDDELTVRSYQKLGGMSRIVLSEIDNVLSSSPEERAHQLEELRAAFVPWLVAINPDTDVLVHRVASYADLPESSRPLIDTLVEKRLLVKDLRNAEVVVEIALESLLRQWDDLAGWLSEDRGDLKVLNSIERDADAWRAADRAPDWLLTGGRLVAAEKLATTMRFRSRAASSLDYLVASRQTEQKKVAAERDAVAIRKLARRLTAALAVTVAILFILLILALIYVPQARTTGATSQFGAEIDSSAEMCEALSSGQCNISGGLAN